MIKKRRVKPEPEMQKDVMINVTNNFLASLAPGPSRHGHNVRHVDTSGKPQFTAIEERVIGLNESRAVYQNFEANEGFDNVPIAFLGCAKKTHFWRPVQFQGGGAATRRPEPRGQRRIPSAPSASLPTRQRPPAPQPCHAGRGLAGQRSASRDSTASVEAAKVVRTTRDKVGFALLCLQQCNRPTGGDITSHVGHSGSGSGSGRS